MAWNKGVCVGKNQEREGGYACCREETSLAEARKRCAEEVVQEKGKK